MKGFHIRIMFGIQLERFNFASDSDDTAEEDFDKAVKELNKIYHEQCRFDTRKEVIKHFAKYGFYPFKV